MFFEIITKQPCSLVVAEMRNNVVKNQLSITMINNCRTSQEGTVKYKNFGSTVVIKNHGSTIII